MLPVSSRRRKSQKNDFLWALTSHDWVWGSHVAIQFPLKGQRRREFGE